jgi:hypothetical protein
MPVTMLSLFQPCSSQRCLPKARSGKGLVRRLPGLAATTALVLSFAPAAQAQTPAPADEPEPLTEPAPVPEESESPPAINLTGPPIIDLSTPAPGPPVERKYRQHDGFYVRVNGGVGALLGASIEAGPIDVDSGGLTLDFDVLVGAGPAPGFTLGGALVSSQQLSSSWETDDGLDVGGGKLTSLIVGPFADGFPNSKGGWHFGGMGGLAVVGLDPPGADDDRTNALGVGGAFWVGHDVWVAPEWSVGGLLRTNALWATNSDDDVTVTSVGLSLMFSVLYN